MSTRSTLCISREAALRKLRSVDWDLLSDEQLENVLLGVFYTADYSFAVQRLGPYDDEMLGWLPYGRGS